MVRGDQALLYDNDRKAIPTIESSVLLSLLYFDIFKYPLTASEIGRFSRARGHSQLKAILQKWVDSGELKTDGTYFGFGDLETKVNNRKKGNDRAGKVLNKARKNARLINSFPFVRAVFLSGSISKGTMAADGDVDYFIITEPGRLWLSRLMLVLYKKVFLLGSYKYFCINYFITSDHLEIEEKNRFTATELATVIPVSGDANLIENFFESNKWISGYYPNIEREAGLIKPSKNTFKRLLERVFNLLGSRGLDRFSMRCFTSFRKLKFSEMKREEYKIAFKSSDHVSKHHPQNFQKKVVNTLDKKVREFEKELEIQLSV